MPETRVETTYYDEHGNKIGKEMKEVSDEELADEAEAREVEKIKAVLDSGWTNADAIRYLKLLIRRLLKKGVIP